MLNPNCESRVLSQQAKQVEARAASAREIEFEEGDNVLVRDYRPNKEKWLNGEVVTRTGPVSYQVQSPETGSMLHRRHADQMLKMPASSEPPSVDFPTVTPDTTTSTNSDVNTSPGSLQEPAPDVNPSPGSIQESAPVVTRKSERIRKQPDRLIESK